MNATTLPPRSMAIRPDLGPLLAVLFTMIDEMRSVVVQVTSAAHQEGTSTVAREVALAAAASGWCKVALIDARQDEPKVLGGGPVTLPGLMEFIDRGEEPILQTSRTGSAQIAIGRLSSTGLPVTQVETVRNVYSFLRKNFSLIVVDCPPVLGAQSSAVLAPIADGTLMIVEAERTRVEDVNRAREAIEQLGGKLLGVVLNKSRRRIPKLLGRFF